MLVVARLGLLGLLGLGCAAHQAPRAPEHRVISVDDGKWRLEAEDVAVAVYDQPFGFTVFDGDGRAVLTTVHDGEGEGRAAVAWTTGEVHYDSQISPGYVRVRQNLAPYRESGEVAEAELTANSAMFTLEGESDEPAVQVELTVLPGTLRVAARLEYGSPRAWSAAFAAPLDERYMGFGERFNRLDQRGLKVFSWAEEGGVGLGEKAKPDAGNPWPNGELMTYYPVPFFVSTSGYGFWMNTGYRSEFDLQREASGVWRASHVGPELDFEVYLPASKDPRPWPYHLVDRFTARTGRPMLPPQWAFGPRRRISRNRQQRDVPEIQAMRDHDLAITAVDDALHFFPHGAHRGREQELKQWTSQARELAYRVNGYFNSFVARSTSSFVGLDGDGAARGYFLRRPDGSYPNLWIVTGGKMVHSYLVDFTQPEAKAWYQQSFDWATRLGYSGWMYDFGEYVPADVLAADGTTGEELHNLYPLQYARALHEAMERGSMEGQWFAFMRSGYTGSSAYVPMVWAGDPAASFEDADGLPSMLRGGLNLGVSGAPFWGSDIGGYHCVADGAQAADEELLVRWIQFAALTPNMQDQDACVGAERRAKATIWNSPPAMGAWRKYARLHTRLQPYLYTWARQGHLRGEPLMRPLFFEHPELPELVDVDDAYYLGPALLVAPVVKRGERKKRLNVPPTDYVDLERRELVHGGAAQELDAPLSELPLLLRAGHIVPLLDKRIDTLIPEQHPEIVGPTDVADVYDAKLLLTPVAPTAQFAFADGTMLSARADLHELARFLPQLRDGQGERFGLARATRPRQLRDCSACFAIKPGKNGLWHLRITAARDVELPGLRLRSTSNRRIRWELFLSDRVK